MTRGIDFQISVCPPVCPFVDPSALERGAELQMCEIGVMSRLQNTVNFGKKDHSEEWRM